MGSKTKRIALASEGTQTDEQARAYYSIDAAAERLSVGRSTIERLLHGEQLGISGLAGD
jgi:transposase